MTTEPNFAEWLANLEAKAKEAIEDSLPYGDPNLYDPRFGMTDVEQEFALAANPSAILTLTAHIRSLTERLEKAEKDARRYRWLRKQNWNESPICAVARPKEAVELGHDCPSLVRLDEAIDAAIAQEGSQHE